MMPPSPTARAELEDFANKIDALVKENPALNAGLAGGALFGAGVEICLQCGITKDQLHTALDAVISELVARGTVEPLKVKPS